MENNATPRENSRKWDELMENGHIASNILISENIPISINKVISEAFSVVIENNWIIPNSSSNKLRAAIS